MSRVLFVSNGHGEAAIADRIASLARALEPSLQCDHLPLVGDIAAQHMRDVGPRRPMPSGGLIAMGNVRNITRDLKGGLLGLTLAQRRFLRAARANYDACVAIGDVYALLMTLAAGRPVLFVGTAKSVYVAPYGRVEEAVLRRAARIFVRDDATARRLREHGVRAEAPGNTIVDLFSGMHDERAGEAVGGFDPAIALFPGSRESAYDDAAFLCGIVKEIRSVFPHAGAAISVAPQLNARRFADAVSQGWDLERTGDERIPFTLRDAGGVAVRAWRGEVGALLDRVLLVMGQAGTANEAAAAAGVPVIAFERGRDRKTAWYRMRQSGLLGGALAIVAADDGAREAVTLLRDDARRAHMAQIGRERMGAAGGSQRIAEAIVEAVHV